MDLQTKWTIAKELTSPSYLTNKMKMTIMTTIKNPFVTTDVKNPTREPNPVFNDCLKLARVTTSSASTAPIIGPSKIPATGMTKGPMRRPIVLPHMPAFDPPNFFTPRRLDSVSAPNNSTMNRI